ncbi:twin-arginine translocase subunit TatC [Gryllotalpicola reticulitermitis]|uniref:Sec-independent protein translocase protein TatC n=1 Tax=Gryllotalpicola reticulitermitis TaxID=1184153 RepID=A0ABV8Q8Q3_9MICO
MSPSTKAGRASRDTDGRMSLGEHLIEFRNRAMIAAAGILVAAVIGWFLQPFVWSALSEPIHQIARHRDATINYPSLTAAFDLRMQLSIYIGIIISSPLWLYQIFAFLTPGLTGKEKRYVFGFFFSAIPLFLGGCAFGWYVTPHIVTLFASFAPTQDATILTASDYFSFVLKLVLAVGVAFVTPVFIVLLNMIGILSARAIWKAWRWAILGAILFAALATPSTDVISMMMLAVPLIVLYFGAASFAWLHDKRKAQSAAKFDAEFA